MHITRKRLVVSLSLFGAVMLPIAPVRAGAFTVDDWWLEVAVREVSGGPIADTWSDEPVNPFLDVFAGTVGASSVSTAYDISWNDTSATFRMDADLLVKGVGASPSGMCTSSSAIWITPHEDMLLTVHSEYTYNLPVPGMQTMHRLVVANYDGPGTIFSDGGFFSSTMGGGSDTFVIDGEVVLPAGISWQILPWFTIWLDSGSTGRQATGSGFFDIQLTTLPEPTTAILLLAAAIPVIARRRCKRGMPAR